MATSSLCASFPHIVSRPGKDILEGVDALVKDGIADPDTSPSAATATADT